MVPEKMLADSAGGPGVPPNPAAAAEKVGVLDAPRPCTSASLAASVPQTRPLPVPELTTTTHPL